ncbi:bifunctional 2-polyprenyl-6-hydroxyphenol methylase/3-demethylubiquinol 3-O-methyltransferase UbiG [Desulfonatronum sp. SC1]|uniref:class I SAM-dependent methyltransferase n=1 Tax=Desulfonatronum sp. SC1 TaxID=2109626 RepID=UPI0013049EF0|nr:class I SAM-dependent methyltransferase [Desulfonatronum sp. SC1]
MRHIARLAKKHVPSHVANYADFGCSNGYLTNLLAGLIGARQSYGFDSNTDNLKAAQAAYPTINFQKLDLNKHQADLPFDFVTCLETLEHVGNLDNALQVLLNSVKPGGTLLIAVPIEIGLVGLGKIIAKRSLGRELKELGILPKDYLLALLRGRRLSQFRPGKERYATHLGFDYRDIDDFLCSRKNKVLTKAINKSTTRFYVVRHSDVNLFLTDAKI